MAFHTQMAEDDPVVWDIVELTSGAQLQAEGRVLQHCVASYVAYCRRGQSRIWSLRRRVANAARAVVTLEVDPMTDSIVQARGLRNRPANGKMLQMIKAWARRENLGMAL